MSAKQEKKPSPVYVIMIFWKCTLYRIQVYQTPPKKLRIKERKKRAKRGQIQNQEVGCISEP